MGRKINVTFLTVLLLFIFLVLFKVIERDGNYGGNISNEATLKSIAISINSKFKKTNLDSLNYNQRQVVVDGFLADSGVDSIDLNDLSTLRGTYGELFLEPYLDDDLTMSIDRIIKDKIDEIIELNVCGKKYSPTEMYIITDINPDNYLGRLENGYADDSFHLSELANAHSLILYKEHDVFGMNLNNDFKFVVEPHIYSGHEGIVKVENWKNHKFNLPAKLSHVVLFSIIQEKNEKNRKYKAFWVLNETDPYSTRDRLAARII